MQNFPTTLKPSLFNKIDGFEKKFNFHFAKNDVFYKMIKNKTMIKCV